MNALTLAELERQAHIALPPSAFDYFSTGAQDEFFLRESRDAFRRQVSCSACVLLEMDVNQLCV